VRVRSLEVKNVCQHLSFRKEFHPGVTVIVGRNGTGKSTVLHCLEAAVTGDWSCFAGGKQENVAQLAGPKEPSYVSADLEHGGRSFRVARWLRPDRVELWVDGRGPETGKARVNEALEEALGVPLAIVSGYGFVRQRSIFDFLAARPADRAAAFQVLTGTDRAGPIHDLLGEELRDAPLLQATDERESLRARVAETERRVAAAAERMAALPDVDEGDLVRAAELEAAVRARAALAAEARSALRGLRGLGPRIEAAARRLAAAGEALAALRGGEEGARRDLAESGHVREAWRRLREGEAARARLEAEVEAVRASRPAGPPPGVGPAVREAAAAYRRDAHGMYASMQADGAFLGSFRDGVAACPTCGTPSRDLQGRLAEAEARRAETTRRYMELHEAHEAEAAADAALRSWERADAAWASRLAEASGRLAAAPIPAAPAWSEAEADARERAARDLLGRLEAASREEWEARGEADRLEADRRSWAALRDDRRARLASPRPDRGECRRAREGKGAWSAALAERRSLEGEVREAVRQVEASRRRLEEVDRILAEAAARNAWRDLVAAARPLVHRDGLPRRVTAEFLARATEGVNEMLATFAARFRVAATDDLSFEARFFDGRAQHASRLSPGEKVVLALAFRVVVNATFARELGVLVLDEPTDGLDQENIGCVEAALSRLGEVSRARDLQVLVVTHERRLTGGRFCDDSLDLGGW